MKLLIDLNTYRENRETIADIPPPDGVLYDSQNINGRKSIRELAVFAYSCRRCKDAPCVSVCPEEALKKDDNGMITRSTHRCIACKSCVSICPFGTMMTDFYSYKADPELYFNLNDHKEREQFIKESPKGSVMLTKLEKDEDQNIFELIPGVLVRDISWEKLKNLEEQ